MTKNKEISTTSTEIKPHLMHLLYSQNQEGRRCTTFIKTKDTIPIRKRAHKGRSHFS